MELFTGYIEDSGIDFMHCFRGGIEPGFSGGPVFNGEGKETTMAIGSSLGRNFVVGIPIKEIMKIVDTPLEKNKKKEKRELGERYEKEQTGSLLTESGAEQEYAYQLEFLRAQQRMLQEEETARLEEENKKPVPMGLLLF